MTSVLRQRKRLDGSNFNPHTYIKRKTLGGTAQICAVPPELLYTNHERYNRFVLVFFLLREVTTYPLYISTLALGLTFFVPLRKMVN